MHLFNIGRRNIPTNGWLKGHPCSLHTMETLCVTWKWCRSTLIVYLVRDCMSFHCRKSINRYRNAMQIHPSPNHFYPLTLTFTSPIHSSDLFLEFEYLISDGKTFYYVACVCLVCCGLTQRDIFDKTHSRTAKWNRMPEIHWQSFPFYIVKYMLHANGKHCHNT